MAWANILLTADECRRVWMRGACDVCARAMLVPTSAQHHGHTTTLHTSTPPQAVGVADLRRSSRTSARHDMLDGCRRLVAPGCTCVRIRVHARLNVSLSLSLSLSASVTQAACSVLNSQQGLLAVHCTHNTRQRSAANAPPTPGTHSESSTPTTHTSEAIDTRCPHTARIALHKTLRLQRARPALSHTAWPACPANMLAAPRQTHTPQLAPALCAHSCACICAQPQHTPADRLQALASTPTERGGGGVPRTRDHCRPHCDWLGRPTMALRRPNTRLDGPQRTITTPEAAYHLHC
jgi:hypothetical protein